MKSQYMSMEQLQFLLFDVHQAEALFQHERFQEFDKESAQMLLNSARDLADKEFFPYYVEMDEKPVRYENGQVIAHPQLKNIIEKGAEAGWIGASFDHEYGGMQVPHTLGVASNHIFNAANNSAIGYLGLTTGAARLITSFGSQDLIDTYVDKMLTGKWMGTMALTEPDAGSSLSDLVTEAKPTEEGHYLIRGQKIFISGGDHQFADNFVHLMLARIEGAPAGTKGISLFVVPKYRPEADGSLTPNDVITAGDFQKMGQKGYVTTHLIMGEKEDCRGWLVGKPHKGLKYMFQMMNAARLEVGVCAASTATAAYYASLQYAKERKQGRPITSAGKKDVSQEPIPIIEHPDVKRMLLLQKAIVEGALSLLMECARYIDLTHVSEGEEREKYQLLQELLMPVAKTYPSEMGQLAINNGLQVLGGYGFCLDFPLQQYYRDIRIMPIYEGTTGIQSLDLLGRKVTMKNGKALQLLTEEMKQSIGEAMAHDVLKPYAKQLAEKLELTQEVLQHLMKYAMQGDYQRFLADASLFMEFTGHVIVAWQWLKMANAAQQALLTGSGEQSPEFYQAKIHTMKFFFRYELPKTLGLAHSLMDPSSLTVGETAKEVMGG
jgi:alkylation response protein AidB-like acyl-CoA dehydrogenase